MNPSGYCARKGGYGRTSFSGGKHSQPGHVCAGVPGKRGSFPQGKSRCHGQRSLSLRAPQHHPAPVRAPAQDDINQAFSLLRTHPQRALDAAEVLLDRYSTQPSLSIRVVQLKARALIQLNKTGDCIALINALETTVQSDKGLLITKARALQARGCLHEALSLFQHLYENHRASNKDHKTHGLGLGRLLQHMGGADNLARALAIFTRLRRRAAGGRANTPCDDRDIELTLGRHLQLMGGPDNLQQALAIFTRLHSQTTRGRGNTCADDKDIELALGRHLELMGGTDNLEKALAIYTKLRTWCAGGRTNTPCDDKTIELTLGRLLQRIGGADNLEQASAIFSRLRTRAAAGRANTPCDDKDIELTLGRHLQLMGGPDNLQKALAIFTRLRSRSAAGRVNTPCNNKEIELALGRHLQLTGGPDNLQQALAIFTRLRTRTARGRKNTPCNDKEIELALGRHLELMGGPDHLQQALAILTRLRTLTAGRQNTPCNDKDIELSLGRLLQLMGGEKNLEKALAIFTRLRTQAALGKENTPCEDPEIEMAVASLFVEMHMWSEFDELRLETRRFPGFQLHLCRSLRNFHELLEARRLSFRHLRLLGQATKSAVLAIEVSGFMNASCLSQLAHCVRLLACFPELLLQKRGLRLKEVRNLGTAAKFLFDMANALAPCRPELEKQQDWRARERDLLTQLSQQQTARHLQPALMP